MKHTPVDWVLGTNKDEYVYTNIYMIYPISISNKVQYPISNIKQGTYLYLGRF